MAVTIERSVDASPHVLWARVTDFSAHGDVIPFTVMLCDPGAPGVGWRFVGRTRLGPFTVDDPMRLVQWCPPGPDGTASFRVVKEGGLLAGWARVDITPGATPRSSRLRWSEEIRPRLDLPLPGLVGAVSDTATRLLFGRAVAALARTAEFGEREPN